MEWTLSWQYCSAGYLKQDTHRTSSYTAVSDALANQRSKVGGSERGMVFIHVICKKSIQLTKYCRPNRLPESASYMSVRSMYVSTYRPAAV